jgi:hypothetical protein
VVAAPDELRGEVIEAFVVLRDGVDTFDEMAHELKTYVKPRYAAQAASSEHMIASEVFGIDDRRHPWDAEGWHDCSRTRHRARYCAADTNSGPW